MEMIDASAEYIGQLLKLMEEAFGSGYLNYGDLDSYIRSGVPFKAAVEGKRAIGTILFQEADDAGIRSHTKINIEEIRRIRNGKKALICKCACIDPAFQNQGIARKLLGACMNEIEEQEYGAVFTVLWKYGGRVPAEKLFQEFQFQRGEELEAPWYDEHSEYKCRICGGPCLCGGIVYYSALPAGCTRPCKP